MSGPSVSANDGVDRQWPGTSIGSHPSSSKSRPKALRRRSSSAIAARQVPDRSTPSTLWRGSDRAARSDCWSPLDRVPGMSSRPATLGQLRESGWESVPVKEEVRRNAVARIRAGEPLFPGVLGYDETVLPQLENALLAGHDVIFLG